MLILLIFSFVLHRANNNWQISYASITKMSENSTQPSKKQRDIGETARDSLTYSCLLKNELLGTGIDDVKAVADDRNENYHCNAKRGLFKYQSPTKQVRKFPFHLLSGTVTAGYVYKLPFFSCTAQWSIDLQLNVCFTFFTNYSIYKCFSLFN